ETVTAAPEAEVGTIDLLDPDEAGHLLPATGGAPEPARLLADLLADAVAAHPDAVALVDGAETLTYAELHGRCGAVAAVLAARGAGPGTHVALAAPRSIGYQVAMWAIARTGSAFVPLDLRFPAERLARMIADCGAALGVAVSSALPALPEDTTWLLLDDPAAVEPGARESGGAAPGAARPTRVADPTYVIYTSGSTGTRKGVVVTHEGLASFAAAQRDRYRVDHRSRVLHVASPAFDAVLLEALMACAAGATLVISPPEVFGGAELARLIRDHEVTHAFLTPSVLATLAPADLATVRVLAVGGEMVPAELVASWAPGRQLHNIYGPTETTIVITMSEPLGAAGPIDMGGPIRGARAMVLDARDRASVV